MASMQMLEVPCEWPDCQARATRRVIAADGAGFNHCSRHANQRLVELAREEGQGHYGAGKPTAATEKAKVKNA